MKYPDAFKWDPSLGYYVADIGLTYTYTYDRMGGHHAESETIRTGNKATRNANQTNAPARVRLAGSRATARLAKG